MEKKALDAYVVGGMGMGMGMTNNTNIPTFYYNLPIFNGQSLLVHKFTKYQQYQQLCNRMILQNNFTPPPTNKAKSWGNPVFCF